MSNTSTLTFRTARLRSLALSAICGGGAWIGFQMVGNRPLFEALGMGGMIGKEAFFTIIMVALSGLSFLSVIYNPRAVHVGSEGIKVRQFKSNLALGWEHVLDVQPGGSGLRRGAMLTTPAGDVLIGDGMGQTSKLVAAIRDFKLKSSARPPRETSRDRKARKPMFGRR